MDTVPTVYLKPGREKSARRRHPWVFSGAIERVEGDAGLGATVRLVDQAGDFVAWGAYSSASQIRLRIWSFDETEIIDGGFLRARLDAAISARRAAGMLDQTAACRLIFSEADGLPGLVVDRYADFLVCQFLSAGIERWRDIVVAELDSLLSPRGIFDRSEPAVRRKEGLKPSRGPLCGESPPPAIEIRSGRLRQLVDIAGGQKTGAYLDQRDNRGHVARYARDARVLDAYSYTGGFALTCLLEGGREATLIDSSDEALRGAARQAELNGVFERCRYLPGSVAGKLRELRDADEHFDLIILDPPKFVHSAHQLQSGSRGYKDINMLGLQLLEPGGILATFSCSGHVDSALFQKIVAGAAVDARRDAQILERLSQPPDHPVALQFPEAEYLKGLILRAVA
jgi:23S rRNA (cytosine1962-C5)-methyltransferase